MNNKMKYKNCPFCDIAFLFSEDNIIKNGIGASRRNRVSKYKEYAICPSCKRNIELKKED